MLDPTDPINVGRVACIVYNDVVVSELVRGRAPTINSAPTNDSVGGNPAVLVGSNQYYDHGAGYGVTADLTMFFYGQFTALANYGMMQIDSDGANSNGLIYNNAGTNQLNVQRNGVSGSPNYKGWVFYAGLTTNTDYRVCAVCGPDVSVQPTLYINGVSVGLQSSFGNGSGNAAGSATHFYTGSDTNSADALNGRMAVNSRWARQLGAAEIARLNGDPYSGIISVYQLLFQSAAALSVPVTVAGGVSTEQFTGQAGAVSAGVTAAGGTGTEQFTGGTGGISAGVTAAGGAGTEQFTGQAGAVSAGVTAAGGTGTEQFTGGTGGISAGVTAAGGTGTEQFTGDTGGISAGVTAAGGAGTEQFTGDTGGVAAGVTAAGGAGTEQFTGQQGGFSSGTSFTGAGGVGTEGTTGQPGGVAAGVTGAGGAGTEGTTGQPGGASTGVSISGGAGTEQFTGQPGGLATLIDAWNVLPGSSYIRYVIGAEEDQMATLQAWDQPFSPGDVDDRGYDTAAQLIPGETIVSVTVTGAPNLLVSAVQVGRVSNNIFTPDPNGTVIKARFSASLPLTDYIPVIFEFTTNTGRIRNPEVVAAVAYWS